MTTFRLDEQNDIGFWRLVVAPLRPIGQLTEGHSHDYIHLEVDTPYGRGHFPMPISLLVSFADLIYRKRGLTTLPKAEPVEIAEKNWAARAVNVHAALKQLDLRWVTAEMPSGRAISTLAQDSHGIKAIVTDFGTASIWKVDEYNGAEASFDMAFVSAAEAVVKRFRENAERAAEEVGR